MVHPHSYIILTPCPKGWFFDPRYTVEMSKLALQTKTWVSWEYENGMFKMTYKPTKPMPVEKYIKAQGRFAHLKDKDIKEMQHMIDEEWKYWEEMDKVGRIILPWIEPPRR